MIRSAPGISGAVILGEFRSRKGDREHHATAMPTPLVYGWTRHGQFLGSAWSGLQLRNISTTGFQLRNTSSTSSGTIYWMSVCASDDPASSSCSVCQEKCQRDCQTGCEDACQVPNGCQGVCEIDCQTKCEGACQDACMFSCQLPPPLGLWK